MKTLKINDCITVNGLERTINSIRWAEKGEGELHEKNEVLHPALEWCILKTDKGELIQVSPLQDQTLQLRTYTLNGLTIASNQYAFPAKTYWYITNKMGETYHHKDAKWRKKELKEMTTYYFTSPEAALRTFMEIIDIYKIF